MNNYIQSQTLHITQSSAVNTGSALSAAGTIFIFLLIALVLFFGIGIFLISFFSKRFHDMGRSGYWGLLSLIPILNAIVGIFLIFKKGTAGPNKYGAVPSTFLI